MSHGARFTRIYTDEQREAFLRAILVDGMGVREAMRAAREGRLGIPAFTGRGEFWGYTLRDTHREKFEATNDDAIERGTREALRKAHLANLKALRELGDDADPAERSRLAKALAESDKARKTQKAAPARRREPDVPQNGSEAPKADGTLGELLKLAGGESAS